MADKRAHLAQGFRRAERQIETRRVGAIDDIDVVIAGQDERPLGEVGMRRQNVEEFGPFGRAPGVGHVPGDEDEVQRAGGVRGLESAHDPFEALVAARAAPSALDAKAVALADDMDVGEMSDPPDAAADGRGVERFEVERLVHGRVGEAPDERGRREIGRHDDDGVGERRHDQMLRDGEIRRPIRSIASPATRWSRPAPRRRQEGFRRRRSSSPACARALPRRAARERVPRDGGSPRGIRRIPAERQAR